MTRPAALKALLASIEAATLAARATPKAKVSPEDAALLDELDQAARVLAKAVKALRPRSQEHSKQKALENYRAQYLQPLRDILATDPHASLRDIGRHLDAMGVAGPTGGQWYPGSVKRVVQALEQSGDLAEVS